MTTQQASHPHHMDFSIVLGGPLYRLLVRAKLVRPPMELTWRRVVACIAITWLPLVLLTGLSGTLVSGVGVPLLFDLDANLRFLVVLPLLIGAEPLVHRRLGEVVDELLDRGLVAPEDEPKLEELVASSTRLRRSAIVEVVLLVLAFSGGYWAWRSQASAGTWYATPRDGGTAFTWAGAWYAFVSLPVLRFIVLRWYFRLVVWYVFVWKVSRLRLRLSALHPDRAGGLGFLEHTTRAFIPSLMAQSAFLAGVIGTRIWHEGAKLPEFKLEIALFVVLLTALTIVPLTFFALELARARLHSTYEFGRLAARYTSQFQQKWLGGDAPSEELLGSADIQSLNDLAGSYEVAQSMRAVPFNPRLIVRVAIWVAVPLVPLALTMVPLTELAKGLVKLIL